MLSAVAVESAVDIRLKKMYVEVTWMRFQSRRDYALAGTPGNDGRDDAADGVANSGRLSIKRSVSTRVIPWQRSGSELGETIDDTVPSKVAKGFFFGAVGDGRIWMWDRIPKQRR